MVLEDLHWADRSTRDLVSFLARTLRAVRVTLVASYRSDELDRRHPLRPLLAELVRLPRIERIELAPFGRAELAEHLEAITGVRLPAVRVERIHARSEGNPFYAEQLLAAGAGDAEVALPPTLTDVVLARVQGLSEPAQQVLRVAAVAGRRVPHQLLAAAAGWPEDDLEQGLREAIGAGVLVADNASGTYAFQHALLQEAAYGELLPSEQTRLHAAYAHLLAAEPKGAAAEPTTVWPATTWSAPWPRRCEPPRTRRRCWPGRDAAAFERRAQAVGAGAGPGRHHRHRPDEGDAAGGGGPRSRRWPAGGRPCPGGRRDGGGVRRSRRGGSQL